MKISCCALVQPRLGNNWCFFTFKRILLIRREHFFSYNPKKLVLVRPRPIYNPPFNFSKYRSLKSHQTLLKVWICFSVFLILYSYSQNTLKLFYRSRRTRPKYLIVFGDCATKITLKLEWFFIRSCLRIRQKYWKGLSHEISKILTKFTELGLTKGREWFLFIFGGLRWFHKAKSLFISG